jgi:hypothetical protein
MLPVHYVSEPRTPAALINQEILPGPPAVRATYWDQWVGRYCCVRMVELASGDAYESEIVRPKLDRDFPAALINEQITADPKRATMWPEFGMCRPDLRIVYAGWNGTGQYIDAEANIGFDTSAMPPGTGGAHRVIY